ncbi:MAG TPA: hypothetical protein VGL16_02635 [Actinomycetota bacterium]|jgi:hypothetical protein
MPTWVFVVLVVWVLFISYVAKILHLWWGWFGVLATISVAPLMRKRWRNPAIVDRWSKPMDENVAKHGPRMWAGIGYVAFAFGLLFIVVAVGSLVEQLLTHNAWNVWGTLASGVGGIAFVFAGRWLIRNRRQPFPPG